MILQRFTTPEQDRDLIIEQVANRLIWLTFNGRLLKTAKTVKGLEKEKDRLIRTWNLKEINVND